MIENDSEVVNAGVNPVIQPEESQRARLLRWLHHQEAPKGLMEAMASKAKRDTATRTWNWEISTWDDLGWTWDGPGSTGERDWRGVNGAWSC